jgi:lipocalin
VKKMSEKIKFTARPNQNTKRYFVYYEYPTQDEEIEKKLLNVAQERGYTETHQIIFQNKDKVRGTDFILY